MLKEEEQRKRQQRIIPPIKVTIEEYNTIKSLAEENHRSISDWIRCSAQLKVPAEMLLKKLGKKIFYS